MSLPLGTVYRVISALVLFATTHLAFAQSEQLQQYLPTHQVSGVIHIWGSPQMGDLLRRYEAGFHQVQPEVRFDDNLKSTLTAVPAVYTGRAEIGLLGREIWPTELQAFASVEGHPPTVIEVATGSYDVPKVTFALMIFVARANPVASLSIQQLSQIFGTPATGAIRTWGDIGLKGTWARKPIHLYGFARDNDKSQIFSQLVFKNGEHWNCGLREFSNTTGADSTDAGELIVRAVAADPYAIGISNVHYATPGVRALPLSLHDDTAPIFPSSKSVADRSYPLSRAVYMVLDTSPGQEPIAATAEFLRFVLSRQGQQAVVQEGNYLPLTADAAARQLRALSGQSKGSQ
jgi:phosphate transport system substrate-binding protein